jgi:aryl-alcohol dehydrogenase-like predicted oxidoreductase
MKTSKLILGTVQFGLKYGINNDSEKPSQQNVNEMLICAFNAGIKCLDTAEAYGDAHHVIGKFHELNPAISFNVITKIPHQVDGQIAGKINQYLEDLKVNRLKAVLFHSFDTYSKNSNMVLELSELKRQQKIELVGVSVYTNEQAEAVIADEQIDIIQISFNLFDNENKRGELLKKAKAKGKIIHTRSAFLQGLFFSGINDDRKIAKSLQNELALIRDISARKKIDLQQIALNYCLQQKYIDQCLIGVDNIHQLQQNIKYAETQISADVIEEINYININNSDLLNPSLWNL